MTSQTRLKVLMALAALTGVYVYSTSGRNAGTGDVVGARDARATTASSTTRSNSAAAVSDEERALTSPSGRNVSSTNNTMSAGQVTDLVSRLNHRVVLSKDSGSLFGHQSWYVPPPPPPPAPVVYTPPPAPTAPPMPFGAMGSYSRPGDATVYFLTRGDRVFDVRVGDTIDNTYKVDGEANGQLLLTYMPLKIQQSIVLGATQ